MNANDIDFLISELCDCMEHMAKDMDCRPLDEKVAVSLLDYLLFAQGGSGKGALNCCASGLITEGEFRDLLMDHAWSTIVRENGIRGCPDYYPSEEARLGFELALFGRPAVQTPIDMARALADCSRSMESISAEILNRDLAPRDPVPIGEFSGDWRNLNPNTRGITAMHIRNHGSAVEIRAWNRGDPEDRDWGWSAGTVYGTDASSRSGVSAKGVSVIYTQAHTRRLLVLTRTLRSRLLYLDDFTQYTDGSEPFPEMQQCRLEKLSDGGLE